MKKLILMACALCLLTAGSASAKDHVIKMYGATAQVNFWFSAAEDFLENDRQCDNVIDVLGAGDCMCAFAEDCGADDADRIIISYCGDSSRKGFSALCENEGQSGCTDAGYAPIPEVDTVNWTCDVNNLVCQDINMAVSDVAPEAFTQQTNGYNFKAINQGKSEAESWTGELGPFDFDCSAISGDASPIVVPFAFMVNNEVTRASCNDVHDDAYHLAYNPAGADCDWSKAYCGDKGGCTGSGDPIGSIAEDDECIGYYKCSNDENDDGEGFNQPSTGQCLAPYDKTCSTAFDCPFPAAATVDGDLNTPADADVSMTECEIKPLYNVPRGMALNIFAGFADEWADFGPAFEADERLGGAGFNKAIRVCSRQAGSGTFATLDKAVMRGDFKLKRDDVIDVEDYQNGVYRSNPTLYMYAQSSSSTRLADCVDDTPMAIGFADVDKLDKDRYQNQHYASYQGVYPSYKSIRNGTYNFYGIQNMKWETGDADTNAIAQAMADFVADQDNLNTAIPDKAPAFWQAAGALNVEKPNDSSYPQIK